MPSPEEKCRFNSGEVALVDINKIYQGDALKVLQTLPDESINCCVTSPPYFGLRDYGTDGQIGMEETPELYVANLVAVFEEVKRVLKKDGTLWLNLGDSYSGSGKGQYKDGANDPKRGKTKGMKLDGGNKYGLKPKDLMGIPWMVAFALRSAGWYLRQDIIWHKPNAMPEPVTDRCTKSHEHIFLLSKSKKYYFNHLLIQEKSIWAESDNRFKDGPSAGGKTLSGNYAINKGGAYQDSGMKNKRDVWTVNTKGHKEAHFAVFPQKLIEDCIKAGCPEGGVVLDPFIGLGTTAIVARKQNKNYVGIELNHDYIQIAERRIHNELGMFA